MRTIVHTLAYNDANSVIETIKNTRAMNRGAEYEYIVADCGFPLKEWNQKSANIEDIANAKAANQGSICRFANAFDARFVNIKNKGVSRNWEQVRQHMKVGVDDVLICADPDEKPEQENWVHAIADVIRADKRIAWCSLMMEEQMPLLKDGRIRYREETIAGHRVYRMLDTMNWAQGGFSGRFLESIGGVPAPERAPVYGWIEGAAIDRFDIRWDWCILADYYVTHLPSPPLYGQWKQWVTSDEIIRSNAQVDFEQWLLKQKK